MQVKRGEIWIADLGNYNKNSSIQGSKRPIVIISNEACNRFSPVITGIPVTSKMNKNNLPTHVYLNRECGLQQKSIALGEQIMPIDKACLIEKVGKCTSGKLKEIEKAVNIQNGMIKPTDLSHINELIAKILDIDRFITKCKNQNLDCYDEELQRGLILGELIAYCNQHNFNYKTLLIKKGVIKERREKRLRRVL